MVVTTDRYEVTEEQLNRCHRVFDEQKQEYFYQVESESEEGTEYIIRYPY